MRNVILTGIPRSGTTLAGALVDAMPDTVCLNEPAWHTPNMAATPDGFADRLAEEFVRLREKILAGEPVPDRRAASGEAVTNYYEVNPHSRQMENRFAVMPFTRPGLSPHFTLAIKHNGPYLSVLPQLVEMKAFTIIAIIRHPLEVIASWRRLSLPISSGQMPNATPYWPEMAAIVAQERDLLVRQVKMYDEMCRRIASLKDRLHLLPYDILLQNPAQLGAYIGKPVPAGLVDKPARAIEETEKHAILAALAQHARHYKIFYE